METLTLRLKKLEAIFGLTLGLLDWMASIRKSLWGTGIVKHGMDLTCIHITNDTCNIWYIWLYLVYLCSWLAMKPQPGSHGERHTFDHHLSFIEVKLSGIKVPARRLGTLALCWILWDHCWLVPSHSYNFLLFISLLGVFPLALTGMSNCCDGTSRSLEASSGGGHRQKVADSESSKWPRKWRR